MPNSPSPSSSASPSPTSPTTSSDSLELELPTTSSDSLELELPTNITVRRKIYYNLRDLPKRRNQTPINHPLPANKRRKDDNPQEGESLDYSIDTSNDPALSDFLDVRRYDGHSGRVVDLGSIFAKVAMISLVGSKPVLQSLYFPSESNKNLKEISVTYSMESKDITIGHGEKSNTYPVENHKRIFMIMEQEKLPLQMGEKTVPLSSFEIFKKVYSEVLKTASNSMFKTDLPKPPRFEIFAVPNNTSEMVKKIIRRLILQVNQDLSKRCSMQLQDIFIVEEYVLHYYLILEDIERNNPSFLGTFALSDIGSASVDTILFEKGSNGCTVLTKTGDTLGSSRLQTIFENKGLNGKQELANLFSNPSEEHLPEHLQKYEHELREALRDMLFPLCCLIYRNQISEVCLTGGVFVHEFFRKVGRELLTKDEIKKTLEQAEEFLIDEENFEDRIPSSISTNDSHNFYSLVEGGLKLCERSFTLNVPCSLQFNFQPIVKEVIGVLAENKQKKYDISLRPSSYIIENGLEIEILIFGIFDIFDIDEITLDNLQSNCIVTFERFSCFQVFFDWTPMSNKVLIVPSLRTNEVQLSFYFCTEKEGKDVIITKFVKNFTIQSPKEKRPPEEIKNILSEQEPNEKTWFGRKYKTTIEINEDCCSTLDKEELKLLKRMLNEDRRPYLDLTDEVIHDEEVFEL